MTNENIEEYELIVTNHGEVEWRKVRDSEEEDIEGTWDSVEDVPDDVDAETLLEE